MTNTEAASVIAILHGAYPNSYFDGAVAEVWTNSLLVSAYEPANRAAMEWIQLQTHFPTVAEFNGAIRRMATTGTTKQLPKVEHVVDLDGAKAAFARGYRQSRSKLGDDDPTIEQKLNRYLQNWDKIIPTT